MMTTFVHRLCADSLWRNGAYNIGVTVVTALLGYVYWIVAARLYTARDIGVAAALISALTLASLISNLGAGSTLIDVLPRRASGRPWSLTLSTALVLSIVMGLAAGVVAVALIPLLAPPAAAVRVSIPYALLFIGGVVLWTAATTLDCAFMAERAAGNALALNALCALLKTPLLVVLLWVSPHAVGAAILASWVLATGATLVPAYQLLRRLGRGYRLTVRGMAGEARTLLSSLARQHLVNLGGSAPMYALPLLVTMQLSADDDAYFYTSWKVGSLFFMVSPAVATALFAEGAYRPEALSHQARRAVVAVAALLGPAMLLFVCGMPTIMGLFGPDYPRHSLPLLVLLMLSAVPDAVTNVYVSVLRVRGQLGRAAALNVGMAVITLALAWLWLPALGLAGAGWAWLAAQTLGGVFVCIHVVAARSRRPSMTSMSGPQVAVLPASRMSGPDRELPASEPARHDFTRLVYKRWKGRLLWK